MKVALVHEMLVKMGGAERVLDTFQRMFPDAPIYTLLYDEKSCGEVFPKEKIHTSSLQKWKNMGIPRQFLVSQMPEAIESFDFSDFDLVISSSSAFAHGIIVPSSALHICYCHSPMRYAWDYFHQYLDEKSTGFLKWWKRRFIEMILHRLRIWDASSASRPDILLANSRTTQKRIEKYWRRNDSLLLYPPVCTQRFTATKSNGNYFLIVSALEPFKKIDIAVQAFSRIPKHKLVIIGEGSDKTRLQEMAGKNIEFLGRKSDEEVQEFLEYARAFIFPGLEDFGIAPVEAMACGKPVIAYAQGGVRESVVEGETGVFFTPQTSDGLLEALAEFFKQEEKFQKNIVKIRERAEEFSEENFRKKFWAIVPEKMAQ